VAPDEGGHRGRSAKLEPDEVPVDVFVDAGVVHVESSGAGDDGMHPPDLGGSETGALAGTSDDGGGGGEQAPGLCCDIGGIYFWNPNVDPRLQCSSTTTIPDEQSCIAANGGSPPPFTVWRRGDPATDQRAKAPRQSSGLVTIERAPNDRLSDLRFSQIVAAHVDTALTMNPDSDFRFVGAFSECYGGGMFDELVSGFDNPTLAGVPLLLTSASRYDEVAYYPDAMHPTDWGWGLHQTLTGTGSALQLAIGAAELDDFRIDGSEHPQYIAVSGGDQIALADTTSRIAILWSGRPKRIDREQIRDIILSLVGDHEIAPSRIYVFYGDGNLRANHELRQLQAALAMLTGSQFDIRRANESELLKLFNAAFNGGWASPPRLVFFFANDHGYNTSMRATARAGGPDDNEDDPDANEQSPGPSHTPSFPEPG
jgi:hypothetical protein